MRAAKSKESERLRVCLLKTQTVKVWLRKTLPFVMEMRQLKRWLCGYIPNMVHRKSLVSDTAWYRGVRFRRPTILNPQVLGELRQLIPLGPLDQPYNLVAIEAALTITSNVVYGKAPATLPIAGYRDASRRSAPGCARNIVSCCQAWRR